MVADEIKCQIVIGNTTAAAVTRADICFLYNYRFVFWPGLLQDGFHIGGSWGGGLSQK